MLVHSWAGRGPKLIASHSRKTSRSLTQPNELPLCPRPSHNLPTTLPSLLSW